MYAYAQQLYMVPPLTLSPKLAIIIYHLRIISVTYEICNFIFTRNEFTYLLILTSGSRQFFLFSLFDYLSSFPRRAEDHVLIEIQSQYINIHTHTFVYFTYSNCIISITVVLVLNCTLYFYSAYRSCL